jgi:hypothetical protein
MTLTCGTHNTTSGYDANIGYYEDQNGYVYECWDEHEVTDTYDCHDNLATTQDVVVNSPCEYCQVIDDYLYWTPYYDDGYGDYCSDEYEIIDWACNDGGFPQDFFIQTVCSSSCIVGVDPNCGGPGE